MSSFPASDLKASTELRAMSWEIVNDTVMGGRSQAKISWDAEGNLDWSGFLSLKNNGGFVSIRSADATFNWSQFDGVEVVIEGKGRTVQVSIQRSDRMMRAGGYRARVPTNPQGETRLYIPFTAFELKRFGRAIGGPSLTTGLQRLEQLGLLMADKREGPFQIKLKSIRPVRASKASGLGQSVGAKLIEAIQQGVPLFNQGNANACADIYRTTLMGLVRANQLGDATWALQTATRALSNAQGQNAVDAAWTYRLAMDQILQSLRP